MSEHEKEVRAGERFEFGKNWSRFLKMLSPRRIELAEESLKRMLGVNDLRGKTFLDVGSGSGLFSLVARRLGAKVHSFDYDPNSVACGQELKRRYFADDADWTIEQGSALDAAYLQSLGTFDVVYSWGVLHHTGSMWEALGNVAPLVKPDGHLFIAIYNDQGGTSRRWTTVKRIYNALPGFLRFPYTLMVMMPREFYFFAVCCARLRPWLYFKQRLEYAETSLRGMSWWYDIVDWAGGYPFEVAKPEEIFKFYKERGYALEELVTQGGGMACNEFVFRKVERG